jgi:signal peptide peptidase SppA
MSKVMQHILADAWAMHPGKLEQMVHVVARWEAGQMVEAKELAGFDEPAAAGLAGGDMAERGYSTRGSVGVLPVGGVISKYSSMVSKVSAGRGTSVVELRRSFANAVQDVKAGELGSIMLLVDSPGGSVSGVDTLAQDIRNAVADGVPVVAYADDQMASAAYWIGSQASEVYAGRTAAVGSIGVYSVLTDSSRAAENAGYKVHLVKAGQYKGTGADGVPVSTEALQAMSGEVAAYYEAFTEAVAKGRKGKLTRSRVAELADGRVHVGPAAAELGLVDGIATAEEVVARMNRQHGKTRRAAAGGTAQPGAASMKNSDVNVNPQPAAAGTIDPAAAAGAVSVDAAVQRAVESALAKIVPQAIEATSVAARRRAEQIGQAVAGFEHLSGVAELKSLALTDASVSVAAVQDKVLQLAREQLKPTGAVNVGPSGGEMRMAALEAVVVAKAKPGILDRMRGGGEAANRTAELFGLNSPADFLKAHREASSEGMQHMTLRDIAQQLLKDKRANTRGQDDFFRASFGHGTSDFPKLLENVANKTMLAAFAEERTTYQQWCRIGSATDFKAMSMVTLSEAQNLVEIPEGKNADESTIGERAETIRLRTFGRRISFGRQMLLNDDLGGFAAVPMLIGQAAARVPEDLAYVALNGAASTTMSDGTAFFATARGNLAASGGALGQGTLEAAITAMQLARGFGKDKAELEIQPKYLLVPTGLQFTAKQLMTSQVKVGGTNGEPNTVGGMLEPINSSRLHRASSTAWYLAADPNVAPVVQVNFLNGQREPIITEVGDGSILGLTYEVIFDCGAALVQPEGAYRNAGA